MADWKKWYDRLKKPRWTPSPDTISTIWMILYPIIFISYGIVFYQAFTGEISWIVTIPFFLNIIFNILFTPIFFVFEDLKLATVDIYLVLLTILWSMISIYPHNPPVAYSQLPYLAWICIASVLQTYIWRKNK